MPKAADLEMLFNIRQTNGDWASIPGHGTPVNKSRNLELTIYRIKSTSLKSKFYIPQVIICNLQAINYDLLLKSYNWQVKNFILRAKIYNLLVLKNLSNLTMSCRIWRSAIASWKMSPKKINLQFYAKSNLSNLSILSNLSEKKLTTFACLTCMIQLLWFILLV